MEVLLECLVLRLFPHQSRRYLLVYDIFLVWRKRNLPKESHKSWEDIWTTNPDILATLPVVSLSTDPG